MACPRLRLSKSQFVKGLQCPLALWYFKHRKNLIPEIEPSRQALFDSGQEVGDLAKTYYSGGIEITGKFYEITKFVNDTTRLIEEGATIIYEAAACSPNGAYSRIDILKKVNGEDAWDMIEVKSSTSVKQYHLEDMAIQRYAFEGAGYTIGKCILMHINNKYVRQGAINVEQLFTQEDITDQVVSRLKTVAGEYEKLLEVIDQKTEPDQPIGDHCHAPFDCDFIHHCWKHMPEYSVYSIFKGDKLRELTENNITRIQDIPEDFELTDKQVIDIRAYKKNEIYQEPANIKAFIDELKYPLYYLDYETTSSAIPLFDFTSPFQQVPFQFSLHIQKEKGAPLEHKEFLYQGQDDPRKTLLPDLIEFCGIKGSVLVYYKAFESTRNKEMGEAFPEWADALEKLNERMIDLWVPFNCRHLYAPSMQSSASIKKVLPAFVPDMSYADLDIKEGESASREYLSTIRKTVPEEQRQKIYNALKVYCEQDTLAMVKLLDVLYTYVPEQLKSKPTQMNLFG